MTQPTLAQLAVEYDRLRDAASALADAGDDAGFDSLYLDAEEIRETIFTTPAPNLEEAIAKMSFLHLITREREGDLTDTGAIDAMADLALFMVGLKGKE